MPNYRFHVINDIDVPDDEGAEFSNLALAHLNAVNAARELAAASVRQGSLDLRHRIDIESETGEVLLTVTFADAIELSQ